MQLGKTMSRFEYLTPKTIDEAGSMLSRYKGEARVIAGGTDLMVLMKGEQVMPAYVINLGAIPDLDYIRHDAEGLKIGALATMAGVEESRLIREKFPLLADAASQMGAPQIRNMATVAGNICRAAPSADMAPALLVLGARVKIAGTGGERTVSLEDFFLGPGETVIEDDEILVEIQVPDPLTKTRGVYLKMSAREALGIAFIGVAVVAELDDEKENIVDGRIALGAVAPIPIRATQAEGVLKGEAIDDKLIEKAAQAAADAARPISDIRSSAAYRMEMVKVMVGRALRQVTAA